MNATLVLPELDANSFWHDDRYLFSMVVLPLIHIYRLCFTWFIQIHFLHQAIKIYVLIEVINQDEQDR